MRASLFIADIVFSLTTIVAFVSAQTAQVSSTEQDGIKATCSWRWQANGPADYYECVDSKAKELRAASQPNVSGQRFAPEERSLTEIPARGQATTSSRGLVPPQESGPGKRLQYFVGTWKLTGDIKGSPFGPAGKIMGSHHNEAAADGLSVISKWEEERPTGHESGRAIYSYDSTQHIYRYAGVSSDGEKENSTGTVEGNTWTWLSNLLTSDGTPAKARFTQVEISPTVYTFKFEISLSGGPWTTVMDGKAEQSK